MLGSEFSGVPFEVDGCEEVDEPSLESIEACLRATSSAKSPPPREKLDAYFLLARPGTCSHCPELVPKISLDPPPGGFRTLERNNTEKRRVSDECKRQLRL